MLELIIDQNNDMETICLVENGKLIERYQNNEESKKNRLEGNIYVAKVADIIPGMQSAFLDFGVGKKGFIHLKDTVPQLDEKKEKLDENLNIKDILKQNQTLLVQVKKDSNDKKGARLSTHISITNKYIVYMPNTNFITISQKIEDQEKKKELINIVEKNISKGNGAIIRTSALDASEEEIIEDIKKAEIKWNDIIKKFNDKKINNPRLIRESENIIEKIITDLTNKKLEKITTNSSLEYNKIKSILEEDKSEINLILSKEKDLLQMYDINTQIEKSENRKIWLNCGGFITIDKTEALTAIDVNTGKYTGKKDLETTIFKVNKEATMEIAKQLRLRDIGGIIIIDYIDMHNEENKNKIEDLLKQTLKEDRAKTQIEGFTRLNLMELTRKHICSHLDE